MGTPFGRSLGADAGARPSDPIRPRRGAGGEAARGGSRRGRQRALPARQDLLAGTHVQLYRPMTAQEYVTTVGQSGDELRPYPRPPAA